MSGRIYDDDNAELARLLRENKSLHAKLAKYERADLVLAANKVKRYEMKDQSRGMDAWQGLEEDEYGDWVSFTDKVR